MKEILYVTGGIVAIVLLIIGIATFSLTPLGLFLLFIVSVASVIPFIALATVLRNQEKILEKLKLLERQTKPAKEKTICTKCEKTYDSDCSTCPHCAYRSRQ